MRVCVCLGPMGYSTYPWVGRCGLAPHTLTLLKTKIADFPTLFTVKPVVRLHATLQYCHAMLVF